MTLINGSGLATGSSIVSGAAALFAVLGGLATGQATVEGDMNPHGAGTVSGVSTVSGEATTAYFVSASILGGSVVGSQAGVLRLATGIIEGTSHLDWDYFINGAGQIEGLATVSGEGFRVITSRGRIFGTSRLDWIGAPLPIRGTSVMVGEPVVDHHLPPVWAVVEPVKSFRYLQHLQRGDLQIFICGRSGPVSPVWVRYTLYKVLRCGARQRIGPAQRTPVQGNVGEYYVAGRAGEGGQPGNWVILWEYRRNLHSATQNKEMDFQVLDAVLAGDPRDTTVRCRKYGWD